MMTNEDYMTARQSIDDRMRQLRLAQHAEVAAINTDYDERMMDLAEAYRHQRRKLYQERVRKCQDVTDAYKARRRALWAEERDLVSQWRSQLGTTDGATRLSDPGSGKRTFSDPAGERPNEGGEL